MRSAGRASQLKSSLPWWLALAFMVGAIVGRLVLPLFELHVTTTISIANDANSRSCGYAFNQAESLPWRKIYSEGSFTLRCNERETFGNEAIQCRCDGE